MSSVSNVNKNDSNWSNPVSFETQVLAKLTELIDRLETINERLDSIDVRLSDLELDTGDGFERDTY